ncbi:MAG: sorbosone dehydrogenase family protein, partial [Chloroflexi bacterium]|nr:sorbosone dehydrogenase family protein [Chloroflexota bacterium]
SSADGMVFYTGDQFPKEYRNNIFIALWGANSGDPRIGKKVLRVVLSGESPNYQAEVSTFATGFGNPLDITVGPDGALYITDFGRGEIVKIYARYGQ